MTFWAASGYIIWPIHEISCSSLASVSPNNIILIGLLKC